MELILNSYQNKIIRIDVQKPFLTSLIYLVTLENSVIYLIDSSIFSGGA
ncbi:protein of unknown function [Acetoanaerobium sticklandii]|uniref:Uncharacterized protein n=1 Tax=Acetoanaerobium sticklandii (strain ATCC 12662 / DSM 519 / JCM 1433 / CCUG 9281 / NCIMB 10654 / HF) TaxID=499177 RepID=E3PUG3_ACESD|nr:protein of unknown function [Acetoanaerobium sticklandii]